MSDALLVVDMQLGFINQFTHHIPGRVVRLLESGGYAPVFFTRFINQPGGPYHRFLDWHACEREPETNIVPELEPFVKPGLVFSKPGFTGMPRAMAAHLRERQ